MYFNACENSSFVFVISFPSQCLSIQRCLCVRDFFPLVSQSEILELIHKEKENIPAFCILCKYFYSIVGFLSFSLVQLHFNIYIIFCPHSYPEQIFSLVLNVFFHSRLIIVASRFYDDTYCFSLLNASRFIIKGMEYFKRFINIG